MRPPSRRCSGVLWTSGVTVLILAFNTGYHITQQEQERRTPRVWRQTSNVRLRALSKAAPPPKSTTTTTTTPAATAAPATAADDCAGRPHTELWGAVIENGDGNPQPDAAACCRACRAYEPILDVAGGRQCNTWVYHPQTRACWLKHQEREPLLRAHEQRLSPPANAQNPWTSGVWLGVKPVPTLPARYNGCVTKDKCNTTRACGSPAIDGYSHVDTDCLDRSPTAAAYVAHLASGADARAHLVRAPEQRADYDGLGVRWGIGNKKATWQECEAACAAHEPTPMSAPRRGPFSRLPCNVWTFCSRDVCFEPDAHKHSRGDCWLKFSENPEAVEVNMREPMLASFMRRHKREMADGVPWVSGALLLPGVARTNGTWGPRAFW